MRRRREAPAIFRPGVERDTQRDRETEGQREKKKKRDVRVREMRGRDEVEGD